VCVYVCVCEREREREGGKRDTHRKRGVQTHRKIYTNTHIESTSREIEIQIHI
jgi:hypothetical protein